MRIDLKCLFLLYLLASLDVLATSEIRVAISSPPSSLSPFYATDANAQNINKLVYRSLIEFDRKMNLRCDLCERYEHKIINGKEIIKFQLLKNLQFSDRTKVTAKDVENSIKYFVFDQNIHSIYMTALKNIERINIIDEYNFEIVFKEYSEDNLVNLPVLKIIKLNGDHEDISKIIGCGNYIISSYEPLTITLSPVDQKKMKLVFKVVRDETTLALKMLNNEIDLSVATISPRKVNWLKNKNKDLKVFMIPSSNYQYIGFNLKNKFLADKKVRLALSHLVPREKILEYKLKNTGLLSEGMFSPAFLQMHQEKSKKNYNPQLAKELLESAGYRLNKNMIWEKDHVALEFEWKISNNKLNIEIAEFMANTLLKNGVKIKLAIVEWSTYMNAFKSGNYDIVAGQWIGFSGPDMLKYVYHSESIPPKGGNRFFYRNKEVDILLDRASREINQMMRISLYKRAENIIDNDVVTINLWHPNIVWIANQKVCKLNLFPNGNFNPLLEMDAICGK